MEPFLLYQLQFARTLICQGTLIPLSQNTLPIYWHLDSALCLYPLPDLIVIGDPSKPFETKQQGCTILNTVVEMNIVETLYSYILISRYSSLCPGILSEVEIHFQRVRTIVANN